MPVDKNKTKIPVEKRAQDINKQFAEETHKAIKYMMNNQRNAN